MHPFALPPLVLVKLVLGTAAAGAVVAWSVREFRRLQGEIERARTVKIAEPVQREALPTLRLDPHTGDYRPM